MALLYVDERSNLEGFNPIDKKVYHLLIELSGDLIQDILNNSDVLVRHEGFTAALIKTYVEGSIVLFIHPTTYKRFFRNLDGLLKTISRDYMKLTGQRIASIHGYPELSKYQILKNEVTIIQTPWEEINQRQQHLVNLVRSSTQKPDFNAIGVSARLILQLLAKEVYKAEIHKAEFEAGGDLYKNQLQAYINFELKGEENKHLRHYAKAIVDAAKKSVDMANTLAHKTNPNLMWAESCVISTVSVVGFIKLIALNESLEE